MESIIDKTAGSQNVGLALPAHTCILEASCMGSSRRSCIRRAPRSEQDLQSSKILLTQKPWPRDFRFSRSGFPYCHKPCFLHAALFKKRKNEHTQNHPILRWQVGVRGSDDQTIVQFGEAASINETEYFPRPGWCKKPAKTVQPV